MFQRKESENNINLFLLLSSLTNCASCSNTLHTLHAPSLRTHTVSLFFSQGYLSTKGNYISGDYLSAT